MYNDFDVCSNNILHFIVNSPPPLLLLMQSTMPWSRSSSLTSTLTPSVTPSVTSSVLLAVALCLTSLLLSNLWVHLLYSESESHADHQVVSSHLGCSPGHFKIGAMPSCTAWLQCQQINTEIRTLKLIGQGVVKKVKVLAFML